MRKSVYTKKYQRLLKALKDARVQANMTQAEVAKAIGRPQSFVSKCESGERRIDVIELLEFCALYQVQLDYMVGPESYPQSPQPHKRVAE